MIPRYRAFYEGKMYEVKAVIWTSRGLYVTLDEGNKAGRRVRGAKLMQSTGVFDKNGQEIFEGDVVNIFGEKLSKIYYSEGAFCVEVLNGGTPLHVYLSEHLEIIGNIYENPELVEGLDEN
ncbi:TPA: hypothetical protein U1628_000224 [Streptococcus suis]|nr:hypothetical protein [Streptococcus suis]NQO90140.1 hypothetical protein [Streptococcus suis]HEM5461010.1 hypothetical protein [Streptococcus suis]